jgi:hypothetical protein
MNPADPRAHGLLCPSAQPEMAHCQVLGTFEEENGKPQLAYLNQHVPVSDQILALAGDAPPTKVFRFAAPCEEKKCMHFDGRDCKLATRIVQILPAVVNGLPPCIVRASCRWYAQEGGAACQRCPQIVTLNHDPSEELKMAAGYTPGEVGPAARA